MTGTGDDRAGDAAELAAIAAGDVAAFEAWLRTAEPRLRASLLSFAATVDVEAVLQETLFRAWSVSARLTPHEAGETLLRWSVRAARNLAVDEARRQGARDLGPVPELAELPGLPDPFLRELIQDCIDQLPRQPGRALAARLGSAGCVDDHELASRVEMRHNTFLQNVSRARRLVRACLQKHGVVAAAGDPEDGA